MTLFAHLLRPSGNREIRRNIEIWENGILLAASHAPERPGPRSFREWGNMKKNEEILGNDMLVTR